MEIVLGLFGFIAIVVFFVMSFNLGNIRKNVQSMQRIMEAWSKGGIGILSTCKKCKKTFTGTPDTCPHCGDPKDWGK